MPNGPRLCAVRPFRGHLVTQPTDAGCAAANHKKAARRRPRCPARRAPGKTRSALGRAEQPHHIVLVVAGVLADQHAAIIEHQYVVRLGDAVAVATVGRAGTVVGATDHHRLHAADVVVSFQREAINDTATVFADLDVTVGIGHGATYFSHGDIHERNAAVLRAFVVDVDAFRLVELGGGTLGFGSAQ